jgi:uncharacterized protein with HEPN domain
MSNRDITLYIVDILIAIDKIKRYTKNIDNAEELLHSELEWDATIRELQVIGDAMNRILNRNHLDNSYRRIVDFRNQIVHGYFGIDHNIVWQVINDKLGDLNKDIIEFVKSNQFDLSEAIEAAIEENEYNEYIVRFLQQLAKEL